MTRGIGAGLVVLAAVATATAAEVDVFLLGGQSNMDGSGQVAELPAGTAGPVADTFFWTGTAFEPLVVATTPTATKPGRFGPEVGFALGMLEAPPRPRYLVKYAVGGAPLHHGWDAATWVGGPPAPGRKSFHPGESAADANQGTLYRAMLERFRRALDALRGRGDTPVVRAFLWMQGEADAKAEESARDYATSLRRLRDRLASDLGLDGLPLVFGQALPHEPAAQRFTHRDLVRARMAAADGRSGAAEAIPGAVMVSTDGFGLFPDTVHYDTAGLLRLGRAFARAVREAGGSRPADVRDVVVYGATSAGIVAAAQAQRLGRSVIVVEPGRHVGGLSTGGLGWTDVGNKDAIGGLAREFYRRIKRKYDDPARWVHETREEYFARLGRQMPGAEDAMWTFEPRVAAEVFADLMAEHGIEIVRGARIDRVADRGVERDGRRITAIRTVDGRRFAGRMFIDATYEGDLMAVAGVSFTVGRESNALHGESLNGVQTARAVSHQFPGDADVDPHVVKGDPSSGLLPGIDPSGPGTDGAGDRGVQAYCFRMCLTDAADNRLPIEKPAGYDERDHELLLRYVESGRYHPPANKWDPLPNRKTDTNNHGAVSTDAIGMNHAYPEADDAERERIVRWHETYQRGWLWTLQNHPRVPAEIRDWYRRWGLPQDEFAATGHWSPQLYVREARRMVADLVMTEHHCRGDRVAAEPVGMGAYTMDSHNVRRYVTPAGFVRNEGDIQIGVPPYPVGYRAIVPQRGECENLLVPVCLSATHIAYGSIRMEPVFMILAQSAATAADLAIEENVAVQDVPYPRLRDALLAAGQVLERDAQGKQP